LSSPSASASNVIELDMEDILSPPQPDRPIRHHPQRVASFGSPPRESSVARDRERREARMRLQPVWKLELACTPPCVFVLLVFFAVGLFAQFSDQMSVSSLCLALLCGHRCCVGSCFGILARLTASSSRLLQTPHRLAAGTSLPLSRSLPAFLSSLHSRVLRQMVVVSGTELQFWSAAHLS
jgi:hypothetical protein